METFSITTKQDAAESLGNILRAFGEKKKIFTANQHLTVAAKERIQTISDLIDILYYNKIISPEQRQTINGRLYEAIGILHDPFL